MLLHCGGLWVVWVFLGFVCLLFLSVSRSEKLLEHYIFLGHHTNSTFTANRHVKAYINTDQAGENGYDVPWVFVKEQDGNNNVYAIVHKNRTVELSMWNQGVRTQRFGSCPARPPEKEMDTLDVSIIGTRAMVWVNGYLSINEPDFTGIDQLTGYVGLFTPNSHGTFDNVVVFDE
jgi:hypothetical protein